MAHMTTTLQIAHNTAIKAELCALDDLLLEIDDRPSSATTLKRLEAGRVKLVELRHLQGIEMMCTRALQNGLDARLIPYGQPDATYKAMNWRVEWGDIVSFADPKRRRAEIADLPTPKANDEYIARIMRDNAAIALDRINYYTATLAQGPRGEGDRCQDSDAILLDRITKAKACWKDNSHVRLLTTAFD